MSGAQPFLQRFIPSSYNLKYLIAASLWTLSHSHSVELHWSSALETCRMTWKQKAFAVSVRDDHFLSLYIALLIVSAVCGFFAPSYNALIFVTGVTLWSRLQSEVGVSQVEHLRPPSRLCNRLRLVPVQASTYSISSIKPWKLAFFWLIMNTGEVMMHIANWYHTTCSKNQRGRNQTRFSPVRHLCAFMHSSLIWFTD